VDHEESKERDRERLEDDLHPSLPEARKVHHKNVHPQMTLAAIGDGRSEERRPDHQVPRHLLGPGQRLVEQVAEHTCVAIKTTMPAIRPAITILMAPPGDRTRGRLPA